MKRNIILLSFIVVTFYFGWITAQNASFLDPSIHMMRKLVGGRTNLTVILIALIVIIIYYILSSGKRDA